MTKVQILLIEIVDMEIFQMTLKLSLIKVQFLLKEFFFF